MEIKKCPFCGSDLVELKHVGAFHVVVECQGKCCAEGPCEISRERAVEMWNDCSGRAWREDNE